MLDVVADYADAETADALSADVDADVSDAARGTDIDLTLCNTIKDDRSQMTFRAIANNEIEQA